MGRCPGLGPGVLSRGAARIPAWGLVLGLTPAQAQAPYSLGREGGRKAPRAGLRCLEPQSQQGPWGWLGCPQKGPRGRKVAASSSQPVLWLRALGDKPGEAGVQRGDPGRRSWLSNCWAPQSLWP